MNYKNPTIIVYRRPDSNPFNLDEYKKSRTFGKWIVNEFVFAENVSITCAGGFWERVVNMTKNIAIKIELLKKFNGTPITLKIIDFIENKVYWFKSTIDKLPDLISLKD